jgi:hypothetical protein
MAEMGPGGYGRAPADRADRECSRLIGILGWAQIPCAGLSSFARSAGSFWFSKFRRKKSEKENSEQRRMYWRLSFQVWTISSHKWP